MTATLKQLENMKNIQKELNEINNNSTLIISTIDDFFEDFRLEQVSYNEYRLYISYHITSIDNILSNNKTIRRILFDDWDTTNLETINEVFSNMVLDEIDDFSKLDFMRLEQANGLFKNTKIKDKFMFVNHTFTRLKEVEDMFKNMDVKELIVDLGENKIQKANGMFAYVKTDYLKFQNHSVSNKKMEFNYLLEHTTAHTVNLTDWIIENNVEFFDFLTIKNIDDLHMPKTFPRFDNLGNVSINIKEIHCNKKWGKFLQNRIK